jgi:predicted small lipoprotein YifL
MIALAGGTAMLSACGQKGALYLPEEQDTEEQQDG